MEECQSWLGSARVWLNRGDLGLGHERICAWHETQASRPHYLFRLKLTANVKRAIAAVPETDWQGPARLGVLQVAERAALLDKESAELETKASQLGDEITELSGADAVGIG
jgi:hypothetical protein